MDTAKINLYLDEAFNYWLKLTGLTGAEKTWYIGGPRNNWHLKEQTEDIQETRRQDPTGLTSFMLMKAFVKQYLSSESFTAWDLLNGLSGEQQARVDKLREVNTFLKQPEIEAYVEFFLEDLLTTVAEYNIDHEDIESWLDNPYWMAILRRDALKSLETLEAHQFCFGEPGTGPTSYGKQIWEFWNMPSLVRAMSAQGRAGFRGIHLCLIRDPEFTLSSFFVLAIVNGESLTVLTDRTGVPHPDYKRMVAGRRPEKDLVRRAEKHWFPYNLLDLETSVDEEGHLWAMWAKARTGLVPVNAQAVTLTEFSKLGPGSAIWLTLLFDLIKNKYLENNHKHKQLSYTVEMVRVPHLLAGPQSALVKTGLYKPLILDALTHADLETDSLKERQKWRHKLHKENQWMLDRYGAQVPEDVFNLIGHLEKTQLESSDLRLALPKGKKGEVVVRGKVPCSYENMTKLEARQKAPPPSPTTDSALVQGYQTMDPISFGSAEDLERDRDWTARKNLCIAVQHLAMREFKDTADKIFRKPHRVWDPKPSGWYVRKVNKKEDLFLAKAIIGEWLYEQPKRINTFMSIFPGEEKPPDEETTEIVNLIDVGVGQQWPGIGWPALYLSESAGNLKYICPFTGAVATYHAHIQPRDGKSLAMILGLEFKQLPWQLQVWQHEPWDVDRGNHILDRCDPAEWALHSPWIGDQRFGSRSERSFPLSIGISLSKRAVNRIRKEHGLPKLDWKALEKVEYLRSRH